jgi:hypothetical protein
MLAAGAAVVLAGCGDSDPQPPRERRDTSAAATDLAILDLLLTLEYFTADVYERMVSGQVLTRIDRDTLEAVRDDENEHVDALEGLVADLGGRRPDRLAPDFDALLDGSADVVLARAVDLEELSAAAYLGQAGRVQNEEVLAGLLSIHTVEGRHAAGLSHRLGRPLVPSGAVARPLAAGAVRTRLARVAP